MSKNSLAARAAAVTSRPEPDAEPAPKPADAPERVAPPRAAPVKMTVELAPDLYRYVKAYPDTMRIPEATGKARIFSVDVFRALVEELSQNEELRKSVAKRIRDNVS